jgi:hypothetical protein
MTGTEIMDFSGIQVPDSALCTAAASFARRVSEPYLFNHVMRSYCFSEIAAHRQDRKYDRELMFISSVLHDLGLTDFVPSETRFEVEGADAAKVFFSERGMPDKDLDIVWDAIALHTTPGMAREKSPEIALCQIGIATDVGVIPLDLLSEALVAEIVEAYPRLNFKQALIQAMVRLYEINPAAALMSPPVADACEEHVRGFCRTRFCSIVEHADFPE